MSSMKNSKTNRNGEPSKRVASSKKRPLCQPPFLLHSEAELSGDRSSAFSQGLEAVCNLLRGRKNIIVITGAGISVSCGIPDFRSKNVGLYETLNTTELGLTCPEDLFDLSVFQEDPYPFYRFARRLYFPSATDDDSSRRSEHRVRPSDAHKLLALLEEKRLLLRCYTQNIDGLESEAGVSEKRIVYAHGSLNYATCSQCKCKVPRSELEDDIWAGRVARCSSILDEPKLPALARNRPNAPTKSSSRLTRKRPLEKGAPSSETNKMMMRTRGVAKKERTCGGVLKPGVTFFGEALGDNVRRCLEADYNKVDACIVIGTSLSVAPISKVIGYLPPNIPRILINRTIVHPAKSSLNQDGEDEEDIDFREDYVFDAYLLGFCDDVTRALAKVLFSSVDMKSGQVPDTARTDGCILASLKEDGNVSSSKKENEDGDGGTFAWKDWSSVKVPRERVFLFPGAVPPATGCNDGDDSSEMTYREVAHCDGCSERIEGTIHKCMSCFDFDLCDQCYPTLSKHHYKGKHKFASEASAPPLRRTQGKSD